MLKLKRFTTKRLLSYVSKERIEFFVLAVFFFLSLIGMCRGRTAKGSTQTAQQEKSIILKHLELGPLTPEEPKPLINK